jgi:glycosyltransferase involved in cell wall biosynthesis
MPTAERTVLHVLPHPGGGGETYVDLLEGMAGFRSSRLYLAPRADANAPSVMRALGSVARAARRHDLLHVHGEVAALLCLPFLASQPSVVTLHGLHLVRRATGARGAGARLNLRAILHAADRTICVSTSEQAELVDAVGAGAIRRSLVIRNGVRLRPRATADERRSVRESLGLSLSDPVAMWVGSLDERKDPLAAVRGAERAATTLLVVGDGPLRADVERSASDRVCVLGERDDVDRLLAAADVFLLTSRREGLAFSLLEAMSRGLAPIVTDLPENREAIGDAGIVVAVGDQLAIGHAFRRLEANVAERVALGERARSRVAESFSADSMVDRTRMVYGELV